MNLKRHLISRHVDLNLHRPVLDEKNCVATFLIFNLSGQIVGFQQYRPLADKSWHNDPREGRYFTFRKSPTVAVFGVESLHLTPEVVFVTEGVFDAVRLTERGASAIAILSNDPSTDVRNFLSSLGRKVVAVCDNDIAGRKLAKLGDAVVFTDGKDLGESSDEFVDMLMSQFVSKNKFSQKAPAA